MSDVSLYFDYAAATPVAPEVQTAMNPYLSELFYNPSANYLAAKQVREALETARAQAAHWLGARPGEIIFTAGGTEANNLAIHGVMRQYPEANAVVSAIEHESVLQPALRYKCRLAPVHPDGRVDPVKLQSLIDDQTVLVSIGYANNEIGTIQALRQIGALLTVIKTDRQQRGIKLPLYLHTDACQAGNTLDLHVKRLTVDMLSLNGSKLYGPKQTGLLYVRGGIELQPLIEGGGQERALRSGTENVAGIIGLAASLDLAQTDRNAETKRLENLQRLFYELLAEQLPEAHINGTQKYRLANNVHVTLPGHDNERLLFALDARGIQAAAGSACQASSQEPSHVLKAIGLTDADAQASLRFSMGRGTTETAVRQVVGALQALTA